MNVMKKTLIALSLLVLASPALAQSPEDPVKRLMGVTEARWTDQENDGYFSDTALKNDFSKSFAAAYKEASKHPAYDDGSSNPFEYDVITSSQDGCPLEDIKIATGAIEDDVTEVNVSFKLWACAAADDPNHDSVNQVIFDIVSENGKPVINDIHRIIDGKPDSLVAEMREIAKQK
jgi:hypothetical protein